VRSLASPWARVACESVYRFLLSPRWLGLGLVMSLAAATMVGLGLWQLERYHQRSAINARIDGAGDPVPMATVLTPPPTGGVGAPPAAERAWARVEVTGRYDQRHEILARARTVNGRVGFEVITPLVLEDGTAVLVDRGWLPPGGAGATAPPNVPAAPSGVVTVVGRVHAPESRAAAAEPFAGRVAVRRVSPQALAAAVPHPLYGAYLTLETQTPPADAAFVPIAPDHENAAMNASYVVQWWLFAALTLVGFGYLVVRERRSTEDRAGPADPIGPSMVPLSPVSPAM
jgi:cytochrome oxidase assembly protein ShyY1